MDWDDPLYRKWIRWSYARRLEIWDENNRIARGRRGGLSLARHDARRSDCAVARLPGLSSDQPTDPHDPVDSQTRGPRQAGYANSQAGKLIHEVLGWDKLIPESTATYQGGRPTFRHAAKPEPEVRLWAISGWAGGIQPWWHHIGSTQEDRRQFETTSPLFQWHEEHEQYLVNRTPIANVGIVWSQQNYDFYGRGVYVSECG